MGNFKITPRLSILRELNARGGGDTSIYGPYRSMRRGIGYGF